MATDAPAPATTIADGDVIARATFGVRNRSRNEAIDTYVGRHVNRTGATRNRRRHTDQKLLTTAANTWLMVVASLAT